jgi:glycosyltransferase involved in cell wall biosynthesis
LPVGVAPRYGAGAAVPRPRRILLLNERDLHHPQAGGAEVHCFEVYRRLAARGDDVTLLASGFAGAPPEERIDGIRVVRVGDRITYYAHVPTTYRRLRASAPFDVVNEQMNKFPYFARLWVREPLVIWIHHLFGRLAFRQVAAPIAAATFAAEALVPRVYRGLPVAAISPSTRDELVRKGFRPQDVHVIPNAVDHARYRPGDGPRATVPTVLAVGRIEPSKRMDLLVEAIARLPGVRLVIAGSGTGLATVQARIAALGVADRVELRGFVDEDEKVRLMQTADVFASASEKEGWGLSVLEAAACRVPTVASDVQGLRDAVEDGVTGLLARSGDAASFARAIARLLDDAAERARFGRAAYERAAWFTWDATADATSELLEHARCARSNGAGR